MAHVFSWPYHRDTTHDVGVLYPWQTSVNLGVRGPCLGVDWGSDAMWCFDCFDLYTRGALTNCNMVISGEPGSGKSAFVKTYLYRTLSLYGGRGTRRWAAIVDPKREYLDLGRALGMATLELYPGGPDRVNPLDAGPEMQAGDHDELSRRRTELTRALLEVMLDRSLTQIEEGAVGWTLDLLTARQPHPSLHDVFGVLGEPPESSGSIWRRQPDGWTSPWSCATSAWRWTECCIEICADCSMPPRRRRPSTGAARGWSSTCPRYSVPPWCCAF